MDKDGYYYAGWGTTVYKVGDVRKGDVHSPIEIVKAYDVRDGVPADQRDKISRIFGLGMTYDGHLVVAMPGIIAVMTRDFEDMQYILLGDEAVEYGVATRAFPKEEVLPAAMELARDIAVNAAPASVAIAKRLLWEGVTETPRETMAKEKPLLAWVRSSLMSWSQPICLAISFRIRLLC